MTIGTRLLFHCITKGNNLDRDHIWITTATDGNLVQIEAMIAALNSIPQISLNWVHTRNTPLTLLDLEGQSETNQFCYYCH